MPLHAITCHCMPLHATACQYMQGYCLMRRQMQNTATGARRDAQAQRRTQSRRALQTSAELPTRTLRVATAYAACCSEAGTRCVKRCVITACAVGHDNTSFNKLIIGIIGRLKHHMQGA